LHTLDVIIFAAVSGITHGAIMVAYNEGVFCRAKLNIIKLWRKMRHHFKKWKWNSQLKRFVEVDFERFYWYLRHPEAITKDTYAKALQASRVIVEGGNDWYLRKSAISRWSYDFDPFYEACLSLPEPKRVVTSTPGRLGRLRRQEQLEAFKFYEYQQEHLDNLFPSAITSELIDEKIEEIQRGNDGH